MAQVMFTSFFNGPLAVYTSPTGQSDPVTGLPERGGSFQSGNYVDLNAADALAYSNQYGLTLYQGRYRIAKIAATATAANIFAGAPAAWGQGTTVQRVTLIAGTGYTPGSYTLSSSTSGGSMAATANVVVGASGAIIAAVLIAPGFGFTSTPTFSLTALGGGSGGAVIAQMAETANTVCSFDAGATQLSSVRGVFLNAPTAAQIAAGAWVVIQESGIASVKITTATSATVGALVSAATAAAVTTTANTNSPAAGFMGYALDLPTAGALCRVDLYLPARQG